MHFLTWICVGGGVDEELIPILVFNNVQYKLKWGVAKW